MSRCPAGGRCSCKRVGERRVPAAGGGRHQGRRIHSRELSNLKTRSRCTLRAIHQRPARFAFLRSTPTMQLVVWPLFAPCASHCSSTATPPTFFHVQPISVLFRLARLMTGTDCRLRTGTQRSATSHALRLRTRQLVRAKPSTMLQQCSGGTIRGTAHVFMPRRAYAPARTPAQSLASLVPCVVQVLLTTRVVPCLAVAAGLPGLDSLNVWALIIGQNRTVRGIYRAVRCCCFAGCRLGFACTILSLSLCWWLQSPRTRVHISPYTLIEGRYKLIAGGYDHR